MSLWQGKRQEARGKSEEGLGDFTFLYTVWFYCVHLLRINSGYSTINYFGFVRGCTYFANAYPKRST
ncbi:MAG: hypothetical protein HEQ20_12480 [Aphanizomenon flos-aquae KM1D3_PB]|nr:MAG: hypothetical protein HEQ20_12480 [Aphanizomenon flos-aquae KM1D3_PB]